jgi:MFS family permease
MTETPRVDGQEAPPARFLPVILTFVFLSVATGSMINVALPFIGAAFDVDEGTYGWIVSGYLLTFGVFSAVHGRLGDLFGVRRLYLMGAVVFALGALLSAASPTIEVLIAVRVLQGAGAAAIPALGATIVSRLLPARERGAAMGAILATVGVAASLSPFLGGVVLELASWRVVFLLPGLALLVIPVAWRVLPASLDETSGGRLDVVGAALLGGGAAALMIATDLVESRGLDVVTGVVGVGGVSLLAALAFWMRHVEAPFVPPLLLKERRFVAATVVGAMGNAARFGTLVLVPILLESTGASPFVIGATLFPGAVAIAVLSPVAGRISGRWGARVVVAPASVAVLLSCVASAWLVGFGSLGMAVAMTLFGAAFAFLQTPLLGSLGSVLPRERLGIGNGLYLMVFFLGGGFGVAVSVSVLSAQPVDALPWLLPVPAEVGRYANAMLSLALLAAVPLPLLPLLASGDPARQPQASVG